MHPALPVIWALQEIDSRIDDLRKRIARLSAGEDEKAAVDAAEAESAAAASALQALEAEMLDVELNLKSTEAKRKDFENRMYSGKVTAAKELAAMGEEIQMLDRNRDRLETRELELMDELKAARSRDEEARKALERARAALEGVLQQSSAERSVLEKELEAATAARIPAAEAAAGVDASVLRKYEALRPKLGGVAVSRTVNQNCGVCNVQVPGHLLRELRDGQEIATCESCGRLLYPGE